MNAESYGLSRMQEDFEQLHENIKDGNEKEVKEFTTKYPDENHGYKKNNISALEEQAAKQYCFSII